MTLVYPAYCRNCDRITGHRRNWGFGLKTECQRCHEVKPVPVKRWAAGTLFLAFTFSIAFYVLYSSLSVLWPLFLMPFIDYDTGVATFVIGMIPGYLAFAWIVGKVIK
jgi:hypothetical protein